jgi:hypothetical protein
MGRSEVVCEQEGGEGLLGEGRLRGFARVRGFKGRVVQGGHLEEGGGRGRYFFSGPIFGWV